MLCETGSMYPGMLKADGKHKVTWNCLLFFLPHPAICWQFHMKKSNMLLSNLQCSLEIFNSWLMCSSVNQALTGSFRQNQFVEEGKLTGLVLLDCCLQYLQYHSFRNQLLHHPCPNLLFRRLSKAGEEWTCCSDTVMCPGISPHNKFRINFWLVDVV